VSAGAIFIGSDVEPKESVQSSFVPAQLPADVIRIIGRDGDLARLETLSGRVAQGGLVVISGQPGVGKTALATRFAHAKSADYPDGQIFVDLRGTQSEPRTTELILTRILHSIGLAESELPSSVRELAALYRTVVSRKRILILLDDAADEGQLREIVPGPSKSLVIVTSRSRLDGLEAAFPLHLKILSLEQSMEVLLSYVGKRKSAQDRAALKSIATACDGLPLALRIAGSSAARSKWSLRQLAFRLSSERTRLDSLSIGDRAVRASFQLSYDQLPKHFQRAVRAVAVIPGSSVDCHLVRAALSEKSDGHVIAVLEFLVDRCLLEYAATDGRYHLHDLLRLFLKERVEIQRGIDERRDIVDGAGRYLIQTAMERLSNLAPSAHGAMHSEPDLVAALSWYEENLDNLTDSLKAGVETNNYPIAVGAVTNVIPYLTQRARWATVNELCAQGLDLLPYTSEVSLALGEELPIIRAGLMACLAESMQNLERHEEALNWCDQVRKCGLGEHWNAHLLNIEAGVRRGQGRYQEALDIYVSLVATAESDSSALSPGVLYHNIGATLRDMGRYEDAIPYLERDLAGCRESGDVYGEAHTLNTIGLAWGNLGELDRARDMLIASIERYRRLSDPIHESYAWNDLGNLFSRRELYVIAEVCHRVDFSLSYPAGDLIGASKALLKIAEAQMRIQPHFHKNALSCVDNAARIMAVEGTMETYAMAWSTLGLIGRLTGQSESSKRAFEISIGCYRDAGDVENYVGSVINFAHSLVLLGEADVALDRLEALVSWAADNNYPRWEEKTRYLVDLVRMIRAGGSEDVDYSELAEAFDRL
jgi:tetratricopeptide (TPR) repeat protein